MVTPYVVVAGAAQHQKSLPEVMYSLSCLSDLYEIGLGIGPELEIQEMRQSILTHIRRTIRAQSACLLLYHATQQQFVSVASQGEKLCSRQLVQAIDGCEMQQLAARGPGETLATLQLNEQRLLLVTLSHNRVLLGIVVLAVAEGDPLKDERGLLLTYLGNVAALILHNYAIRNSERNAAVEQERKRIARDLHDGGLQQIAYALRKLELIQYLLEHHHHHQALPEVKRVVSTLHTSLQDIRASIYSAIPAQLEKQELPQALHTFLQDYTTDHPAIEIVSALDELWRIPERLALTVFHVVQEALTNISKHAQATHIAVVIRVQTEMLLVEIQDNGVGFQPMQLLTREDMWMNSHLGLRTMRERVQEAGGVWEIQSQPGIGTTVRAQFPLVHEQLL